MARFFGTNGIRGAFPEDLTLEFVHDMTLAIAAHFGKGPILVGCDGRSSSPVVGKVVRSALNFAGLDCSDAGLVPTPCLEYSVRERGYAGGIMVTASHNPPQYNGIKPVAGDGVEVSREDELAIEDIFLQKRWGARPSRPGASGRDGGAVRAYQGAVASRVSAEKIRRGNFKVALDLGNGAQAVAAPGLAEALGCRVVLVNGEIDGAFPGRGPEPTPQNLSGLSRAVLESRADMGIAFDGDGDRSLFCDDRGAVLTGDRSALLLSRHVLARNPGATVVTCVNSGSAIEAVAGRYGSEVIRTRVGSVEVSRRMVAEGALVGFEENGGFMFGSHNQVRDGAMAMALMLDMLAGSGRPLSDLASELPESFTTKDKIPCSPEQAGLLMGSLAEEFPGADTTDGIKIPRGEGSWVMVRPSGTEPIIRVYAEARSRDVLDALMAEFMQRAESVVGGRQARPPPGGFSDNTFKTNRSHDGNGE